jgi:dTDP-4-dehydrorhamnose reductase
MKILVLGASGYTGSKIKEVLLTEYQDVYGTYFTQNKNYEKDRFMFQYKLGDDETLKQILEVSNPDIVISSLIGKFSLILHAHQIIADILAEKQNKRMIFISTSNVYDGALDKAHAEIDIPKAESEYGNFKIDCENLLSNKLGENTIIIRVPEIWGINCPRILKFENNIKKQTPIQTYKNIYVNYTTNKQIAEWILYIVKNDLRGTFHIGSKDTCEYIEFQNQLYKKLNFPSPSYNIKRFDTKLYQAVLPSRKEIPDYLQKTISGIIDEIT